MLNGVVVFQFKYRLGEEVVDTVPLGDLALSAYFCVVRDCVVR